MPMLLVPRHWYFYLKRHRVLTIADEVTHGSDVVPLDHNTGQTRNRNIREAQPIHTAIYDSHGA